MTDFDIQATHACGHTERHTGGSASGDMESLLTMFLKRKCSACRPTCEYCHRVGDRENMLVTDDAHIYCNAWCRVQSLNPTHYREYNEIPIPGFLRNWSDTSWHNDVCGSSMYALVEGFFEIRVWVEHEKPEDRDDPDSNLFTVEFLNDGDSNDEPLYAGNDAAVAAQWARAAEDVASGAPPDADIEAMVLHIHELMKSLEVK